MRDVMRRHRVAEARVRSLLDEVGLPFEILRRRPGQVSGGELQRIAIVRAMLARPVLVIADAVTHHQLGLGDGAGAGRAVAVR